jgi:hypothetical protein
MQMLLTPVRPRVLFRQRALEQEDKLRHGSNAFRLIQSHHMSLVKRAQHMTRSNRGLRQDGLKADRIALEVKTCTA